MSDSQEAETAVQESEPIVPTATMPREKTGQETRTKRLPPYNVSILHDEDTPMTSVDPLLAQPVPPHPQHP